LKHDICTTVDVVSHWLLNMKAWILSQGSLYAICGGQSENEKIFLWVLWFFCELAFHQYSKFILIHHQCYIM